MKDDRSYIDGNNREREHLRALVDGLDDDALTAQVNEYWTVAVGCSVTSRTGTSASWSSRRRFHRGEPFVPGDAEPDGDWLNDTTRPLIHAIAPREAARFAMRIAEQTGEIEAALRARG